MAERTADPRTTVFCTVVARNYLPQALTLQQSVARHHPEAEFVVLVVDGRPETVAPRAHCRLVGLEVLGLSRRELDELTGIYDVVELSTGVKALFLQRLLDRWDRAVYLDPDTWIVSPLDELGELIDAHGVVLTPHILEPIPPGESFRSEINTLTVGVHNLGFCAVGRTGIPFLEWWWSHLKHECLIYPLLGLFVDQKWTDIGAVMFDAQSLRHYGYNIGHWNLQERRFTREGDSLVMERTGEPVRLFHFSGFDPHDPDAISERQTISLKETDLAFEQLSLLSHEYAQVLLATRAELGTRSEYGFDRDSSGRHLSKRIRRTFRKDLLSGGSGSVPSPFLESDRDAFRRWRLRSLPRQATSALADSSLAFKYAFPDTYTRIRKAAPTQFHWVRERLLAGAKIRR